jgi:hypothetical protein
MRYSIQLAMKGEKCTRCLCGGVKCEKYINLHFKVDILSMNLVGFCVTFPPCFPYLLLWKASSHSHNLYILVLLLPRLLRSFISAKIPLSLELELFVANLSDSSPPRLSQHSQVRLPVIHTFFSYPHISCRLPLVRLANEHDDGQILPLCRQRP